MTTEEHDLEVALRRAFIEPGHRPEFYKRLLDSHIWVLGHAPDMKRGEMTIRTGDKLMIERWQREDGKVVVPFFSSIPAIERSYKINHRGFTLVARGLFQTMPGSHFVLNPNSRYYWEFHPEEIAALLVTGVNHFPEKRVFNKPTPVRLEPPKDYPSNMVAGLSVLFSKHNNIQRAYLTLMTELESAQSQCLVIGIQGIGDLDPVIQEMGTVISCTKPRNVPVDIADISSGTCVFAKHFADLSPFYITGASTSYERTH